MNIAAGCPGIVERVIGNRSIGRLFPIAAKGHLPTAARKNDDRLSIEVYRPAGYVSAVTRNVIIAVSRPSRRWMLAGRARPVAACQHGRGAVSDPSLGLASRCYLVVALLHFVNLVDAESVLFGEGGIIVLSNRANLHFDGCTAAK